MLASRRLETVRICKRRQLTPVTGAHQSKGVGLAVAAFANRYGDYRHFRIPKWG
jgi:hypothetical protein